MLYEKTINKHIRRRAKGNYLLRKHYNLIVCMLSFADVFNFFKCLYLLVCGQHAGYVYRNDVYQNHESRGGPYHGGHFSWSFYESCVLSHGEDRALNYG